MIRNRSSRDPFKVVRQLDAFPKVPEEYRTSTKIGGTRKHFECRTWFFGAAEMRFSFGFSG